MDAFGAQRRARAQRPAALGGEASRKRRGSGAAGPAPVSDSGYGIYEAKTEEELREMRADVMHKVEVGAEGQKKKIVEVSSSMQRRALRQRQDAAADGEAADDKVKGEGADEKGEADESETVEGLEEFYQHSADSVDLQHGLREVRRLACALRFLVEERDVEQEILAAGGYVVTFENNILPSTIVSGAKSVEEFDEEQAKLKTRNEIRRKEDAEELQRILNLKAEQELRIKLAEQDGVMKDEDEKRMSHPEEQVKMGLNYRVRRSPPGATVNQAVLSSVDDFEAYVSAEVREREHKVYARTWAEWERKNARERDVRAHQAFIVDPDAFDPDPVVTEFEMRSYQGLMRFLFERAMSTTPDDFSDNIPPELLAKKKKKRRRRKSVDADGKEVEEEEEDEVTQLKNLRMRLHFYFVQKLRKFLLRLRRIEINPRPLRDTGREFLHKIDNYLAILLFRRKLKEGTRIGLSHEELEARKLAREEAAKADAERKQAEFNKHRLVYWQALVHEYFGEDAPPEKLRFAAVGLPEDQLARTFLVPQSLKDRLEIMEMERSEDTWKRAKFYIYGFLLTAIVAFSVWGLYEIWRYTATRALRGVADKLSNQIETQARGLLLGETDESIRAARLLESAFLVGSIDPLALTLNRTLNEASVGVAEMDRVLAGIVALFNVSSAFITTESGAHAIARAGEPLSQPQGSFSRAVTIDTLEIVPGSPTPCLVRYGYNMSAAARVWSSANLISCINSSDTSRFDVAGRNPTNNLAYERVSSLVRNATFASALANVSGDAALFRAIVMAEGWDAHVSDLVAAELRAIERDGISFATAFFTANRTAGEFDPPPPNRAVVEAGGGSTRLRFDGVLGVELTRSALSRQLSVLQVGVTGVVYVMETDPTNSARRRLVASSSVTAVNRELEVRTSAFMADASVSVGSRERFNCTGVSAVQERDGTSRFTDAEKAEIFFSPVLTIGGQRVILSSNDFDSVYVPSVPSNLRVPNSWIFVVAFPASDYFQQVTESEEATLSLGLFAVLFAVLLLYSTNLIIPNVNQLRAKVMATVEMERQKLRHSNAVVEENKMTRVSRLPHSMSEAMLLSKDKSTANLLAPSKSSTVTFSDEKENNDAPEDTSRRSKQQQQQQFQNRGTPNGLDGSNKPGGAAAKPLTIATLFGEKWESNTTKYVIMFFTIMVVLTFSSIAFVWSTSSDEAVTKIADDLMAQAQRSTDDAARRFLAEADVVNHFNMYQLHATSASQEAADFLAVPDLYAPGNPVAPSTRRLFLPASMIGGTLSNPELAYDAYFVNLLRSLRGSDDRSVARAVYVAFANGDIAGAELDADTGLILVTARDNFTSPSNCFTKYKTRPDGTRDKTQVVFQSAGCVYDAQELLWFRSAVRNVELRRNASVPVERVDGVSEWTSLYLTEGREALGLTTAAPFLDANYSVLGVFGVDVDLDKLSATLADMQTSTSCFARFFIVQPSGELVASSQLETVRTYRDVSYSSGNSVTFLLPGSEATDREVSRTSRFLEGRAGGLGSIGERQLVERPLGSPITGVAAVRERDAAVAAQGGSAGISWVLVVTLPFDVFLGQFENFNTLSFLLAIATILIIGLMVAYSFRTFELKIFRDVKPIQMSRWVDDQPIHVQRPWESNEEYEKRSLTQLMHQIRAKIQRNAAFLWNRFRAKSASEWQPIATNDVVKFVAEQGVAHIRDAQKGRDILRLMALEQYASSRPRRSYKLYTSASYTKFVHGVVYAHIALALFDPDTKEKMKDEGISGPLAFLELCMLGVESFDLVLHFLLKYRWIDRYQEEREIKALREKERANGRTKDSFSLRLRERFGVVLNSSTLLDFAYTFMVFLVLVDWYVKVSSRFSMQYWFPFRPFLILFRNRSLRRTSGTFVRTVYNARYVFLMYALVNIIGAVLGVVLFRNTLPLIDDAGVEASYTSFVQALTSTFVFISTGDNYSSLVYPAYRVHPLFMLYFLIFIVFGMFFVLAMVIGFFQVGFLEMSRDLALQSRLQSRTGIVACFILLDLDSSSVLSWQEMENFFAALRKDLGKDDVQIREAYTKLRREYEERNGIKTDDVREDFRRHANAQLYLVRTSSARSLTHSDSEAELSQIGAAGGPERTMSRTSSRHYLTRGKSMRGVEAAAAAVKRGEAKSVDDYFEQVRARGGSRSEGDGDRESESEADVTHEAEVEEEAGEVGLDVAQFVSVVEQIKWNRRQFVKDIGSMSKFRQYLQIAVYMQGSTDIFVLVLVIAQCVLVSLYGTVDTSDEVYLEWFAFGLFWFHVVDVMLRLYAFGWKEYWLYSKYHKGVATESKYVQMRNRFDLFIMVGAILGFLFAWSASGGDVDFDTVAKQNRFTIVATIPVLRIFSVMPHVKDLFFALILILPQFTDLFVLLILVLLIYGIIGVNLFAGKFTELLQGDAPDASFDTLRDSLQSLFQILIGEGWDELMYAGIKVRKNFTVAWYFISFVAIATLLFVNIFIGLVLQAFHTFYHEIEEAKREEEEIHFKQRKKEEDERARAEKRKAVRRSQSRAKL
jgi:hypothetical protein